MAAAAPFSPGSGWFPSASLPGVRDDGGAPARRARRRAARRIVILAAVAALVTVLALPRAVEALELGLTTQPATDDIVRVLADDAASEALRANGVERTPRVLAAGGEPGQQRWLVVDVSERPDERPADHRLLRFDGTGWTILGPDEGMPRDDQQPWTMAGPQTPVALAVDRTGRAWFSLDRRGLWRADDEVECVRFPGLGSGALDLASTPDGAIWIVSSLGRLYRWNPEACSAR